MNKLLNTKMIYPVIAVILVIALFLLYKKQAAQVKVSEFGNIMVIPRIDYLFNLLYNVLERWTVSLPLRIKGVKECGRIGRKPL